MVRREWTSIFNSVLHVLFFFPESKIVLNFGLIESLPVILRVGLLGLALLRGRGCSFFPTSDMVVLYLKTVPLGAAAGREAMPVYTI